MRSNPKSILGLRAPAPEGEQTLSNSVTRKESSIERALNGIAAAIQELDGQIGSLQESLVPVLCGELDEKPCDPKPCQPPMSPLEERLHTYRCELDRIIRNVNMTRDRVQL